MRVLHVVYTYHPDPVGGTEVYAEGLSRALAPLGWDCAVAAPGERNEEYEVGGLRVLRYAGSGAPGLDALYGTGAPAAADRFAACIARERPDLVHFHALTAGASVMAMQVAAERRIPVVFTYHTPTVSCPRGTLMRWGSIPCDGVMRPRTCTACTAHGKGLPLIAALLLGAAPPAWLDRLGRLLRPGRAATALRLPFLVRQRLATTRAAWETATAIVSVCSWGRQVMARNGVPASKLALCRQGTDLQARPPPIAQPVPSAFDPERPLRLAFFGRIDPNKGLRVLTGAMARLPGAALELDVHGAQPAAAEASRWLEEVRRKDRRIRWRGPVPHDEVVSRMRAFDLVVAPSVCLETGPLVVYEAFAAGVPVMGSRLGGIAELVRDDVDGCLVEPGSAAAWATALTRVLADPRALDRWRAAIQPPRTMADAAREMDSIYGRCLATVPAARASEERERAGA